jgi:dihydrofolate reductase
MRKIVASLFMSLHGDVEAPQASAFAYSSDEKEHAEATEMAASDVLLLGRETHEKCAEFCPYRSTDNPVANSINTVAKHVHSTTLNQVAWQNSILISGNLNKELARLKELPGNNITVSGSATLSQSLLRDNLLDELRLQIPPAILGNGKRLFPTDECSTRLERPHPA